MKNINNNHGFTLVELLAVIVVLAIVMLVAVQSVLPQMEKARRQTFALDAQTAIESANTYFMNQSLSTGKGFPSNETTTNCVEISTLISQGYFTVKGSYDGKVIVKRSGNNYVFKVWLHKDQLMILGAGANDDESENVQISAYDANGDPQDVLPYDTSTNTSDIETKWVTGSTTGTAYSNQCGTSEKL